MKLEDLLTQGNAARRSAQQRAEDEAAGQLAQRRADLAVLLPAEVWATLGIAPGAAVLDDTRQKLRADAQIPLPDGGAALGIEVIGLADSASIAFLLDNEVLSRAHLDQRVPVEWRIGELATALSLATTAAHRLWVRRGDQLYDRLLQRINACERAEDVPAVAGLVRDSALLNGVFRENLLALADVRRTALAEAVRTRQAAEDAIRAQVRELARSYMAETHAWQAACHAWAETELARRWQPWGAWHVRYAPEYSAMAPREDQDVFGADLIQDVVCAPCWLEDDDVLVPEFKSGMRVMTVGAAGSLGEMIIGAFLDARPITYRGRPKVGEEISYHRVLRAGAAMVCAPPISDDPLPPAPVHPGTWSDRLNGVDFGNQYWLRNWAERDALLEAEHADE